jgi:hypothetical protein
MGYQRRSRLEVFDIFNYGFASLRSQKQKKRFSAVS